MRINNSKRIGQVLFIVEGSKTEFSYIKKIFHDILGYQLIAKRRNRKFAEEYASITDPYSRIAVINTRESNIKDISNTDFLESIFESLIDDYQFPVDQSAIFYLFDRDPQSNTDPSLIETYILSLADPYDNEGYTRGGQLLLSYPSIESYKISNFMDDVYQYRFCLGKDLKHFMAQYREIQDNKITDTTIIKAAEEFHKYLSCEGIEWNIDEFAPASQEIFIRQEGNYMTGGYQLFSMLTLALLQLGILDI